MNRATASPAALLSALLWAPGFGAPARAQCIPQWTAYSGPQLDNGPWCITVWDPDGPGPLPAVVVAGGNFQNAGATNLGFVGRWDGASWQPMGQGVSGTVKCATVFDPDGNGPSLPQPVIGGFFTQSGAAVVNCIARFDGTQWVGFGSGFANSGGVLPDVACLTRYGGSLVAGGVFSEASGVPAHDVARWDGGAWQPFTTDLFAFYALGVHAGTLYAGGSFPTPPNFSDVGVVGWDGQSWVTVGPNHPKDDVRALTTYRGQLIVGGNFTNQCCGNPPAPGEFIARFDGAAWLPLGSGFQRPG